MYNSVTLVVNTDMSVLVSDEHILVSEKYSALYCIYLMFT